MSDKISNIAKNTTYFTVGLILQKIISFSYFVIIARALSPEDLGKYYFAISFTGIFGILIDIGLANWLTREVAKPESGFIAELAGKYKTSGEDQENQAGKLLGAVMAIKVPTSFISLLIVGLASNFGGYPEITKNLIYMSSICMILDSFTMTFFSVVRGFHNLLYESISSILFQVVVFSTGWLILKMQLGLFWLMFALAAASIFNFLYSFFLLRFKYKISIRPIFHLSLLKRVLIIAVPFAIFGILQRLYTYCDSVLLAHLAGDRYVGLYQIAFKIINALQFLPMAFVATLYPAFSFYWQKNRGQLSVSFERAMNYLILISLPISIGTIASADKIVIIFKAKYLDAVLSLQIIMIALLFIFISFPIGSLLNAANRQNRNTINMGIVLAASLVLNILLIPKYSIIGASLTVVLTNILMFALGIAVVPQIIKYRVKNNLIFFAKTFIASLLMGASAYYLKHRFSIIPVVFASSLVYLFFVYLFKAVRKEDIASIIQSFMRKKVEL